MERIYDNGTCLLGQVKKIKEYNDKLYKENNIDEEEWIYLLKELVWYEDSDIVSINYDNGMGMTLEVWKEKDIIEEEYK